MGLDKICALLTLREIKTDCMIDTYLKLLDLLDKREIRNALLLFAMMLIMALLETTGVVSIMPFIAVVANPDIIESNRILKTIYHLMGFSNTQNFLLFIGCGVFGLVVSSLSFKALTQWAIARYTHMRGYTLSRRLLQGALNQPYTWFLNRHSADLGKSILSEVTHVVSGVFLPALQLVAQTIVTVSLVTLVVVVEPTVAITAVTVLGGGYILIYVLLRRYLTHLGVDRLKANRERFQVAQEALGGIKDVKVLNLEGGYLRSFSKAAARFAKRQATNQIIGALPTYFLQGIAFGGILAILLIFLETKKGDLAGVLPVIALYAFAGMRLLPAMQQVYNAMTKLRFSKPALDALHKEIAEVGSQQLINIENQALPTGPITLNNRIELNDICYTYPKAEKPALQNLSITIKANTTVAFIGSTGAGKTTAVDLILGLLEPQQGELLVDGRPVTRKNTRAWQRNIGYVSQHIFLSDDTIAANIAFGKTEREIDMALVERASKIAELHDFVINELPQGYQTTVGERGVRLSGGQRQRIGIARALYHDPDMLILDEATSALDNLTEKAIMRSVHNIGARKTIILIAHRLSTVERCDWIYLMENGHVRAMGKYQELLATDNVFQEMVRAADAVN